MTAKTSIAELEAWRRGETPPEEGATTHWAECWRKHHYCAVVMIERLFEQQDRQEQYIAEIELDLAEAKSKHSMILEAQLNEAIETVEERGHEIHGLEARLERRCNRCARYQSADGCTEYNYYPENCAVVCGNYQEAPCSKQP